jgi:hypothetical protein
MAKKISGNELTWLVSEALTEATPARNGHRITLAVIPDDKLGWRAVVAHHSRKHMQRSIFRKLAEIEHQLRREYTLSD